MPLCKACHGCGGMVHIRKLSCSCGHVFAKHKHLLTPSRKHTLHSFRATETVEKAADRRSVVASVFRRGFALYSALV